VSSRLLTKETMG